MVVAPRHHNQDDLCARIVALLKAKATFESLCVVDVGFQVGEAPPIAVADHRVPGPEIAWDRQRDLAPDREWRGEHCMEALEESQLARVP